MSGSVGSMLSADVQSAPPAACSEGARPEDATTLDGLIDAQVRRHRTSVALSFGERHVTYGELGARAEALGGDLQGCGVERGSVVTLELPRGPDLIVAMVGVLKAGAAYVVLDPMLPDERRAQMLRTADPCAHISDRGVTVISGASPADDRPSAEDRLAYIYFTSGSTGNPRGIGVEHRGVVVHMRAAVSELNVSDADVVLQTAPISHHPSVREVFCTLAAGARLEMTTHLEARDPRALLAALETRGVTALLSIAPSMLRAILDLAAADVTKSRLRVVVTCAERLLVADARRAVETFGCSVVNHFGPTECIMAAATHTFGPDEAGISVLAGHPFAGARLRLVNERGVDVPKGNVGELLVSGVTVARGYYGDPQRTRDRFSIDLTERPPVRTVRTGDLMRQRSDGNFEFVGRRDEQLNIRGFRVESGEVEAALLTHPQVRDAAVVSTERGGRLLLAAHVVTDASTRVSSSSLREHVRATLPDYMIPATVTFHTQLPTTSNGKVDRAALRPRSDQPRPPRPAVGCEADVLESCVLLAMSTVLAELVDSLDADFFDLGGDSLAAAELVERLRAETGASLALSDLMAGPTARQLARRLARGQSSSGDRLLQWREGQAGSVVCLHGWVRELFRYRTLLPFLPTDRSVFGLAVQSVERDSALLVSVSAMARRAIPLLRPLLAAGPVDLVGHSFGGLVAQEIARLLAQEGQYVRSVLLLDSICYGATVAGRRRPFARGPERNWARRFDKTIRGLVWSGLQAATARLGIQRRDPWRFINRANHFAGRLFVARPWAGRAMLVTTPGSVADAHGDCALGWSGIFGQLEIHPVATGHWSLLDATHGRLLANLLNG